jgi:hypothetical protein
MIRGRFAVAGAISIAAIATAAVAWVALRRGPVPGG